MVYAACEIVFVHLHRFPRALLWTLALYSAEAVRIWNCPCLPHMRVRVCVNRQKKISIRCHGHEITQYPDYTQALSIPVQLAVRVYVAASDEPGVADVLDFDDADGTGQ